MDGIDTLTLAIAGLIMASYAAGVVSLWPTLAALRRENQRLRAAKAWMLERLNNLDPADWCGEEVRHGG